MKKFNEYLQPKPKQKELSLTEKVWLESKKKTEEEQKKLQESLKEEQRQQEELKKKLVVEKIVDINVIREEFVDNIIEEEPLPINEEIPQPQPIIEQVIVQGTPGQPGSVGPQGPKGDRGEKGVRGDNGSRGEQGPKGDRGEKGEPGEKGESGENGDKGDRGDRGPKGDRGDKGDQGEKGDKGDTGLPGKDGLDGKNGADGKDGTNGEKGDRGDKGDQGPKGDTGDRGEPGQKGDKGDTGDRGEKGDKGDKGDNGETPDIKPLYEKFNKLSLDINKKVGRIVGDMGALNNGGGSGSYWLNDLGDTDYSSILNATHGQVLQYDAVSKKWKAGSGSGGGSGIALTDLSVTVDGYADGGNLTYNNTTGVFTFTQAYDQFARNTANGAYSKANSANVIAQSSYNFANTINVYSYSAYSFANSVNTYSYSAYAQANASNVLAQAAFNQANTGTTLAQAAYDYANTLPTSFTTDRLIASANSAILYANGEFHVPSNIVPLESGVSTLGTANNKWADVWIGPNTLNIQDQITGNNAQLTIQDGTLFIDNAQRIQIGDMAITTNGISLVATATSANIAVGALYDTGYLELRNAGLKFRDGTIQNTAISTVDSLTDAVIVGPQNGQILTYSTALGQWINQAPSVTSNNFTTGYYGSFYYNGTDITLSNNSIEYIVPISGSYAGTNGITFNGNNDIVFAHAGVYEVTYSIQFENSSNSDDDVSLWVKQNGSNLANTASIFSVVRKNAGNSPGSLIAVTPFLVTVEAGDVIQLGMASADGHVKLKSYATQTNPTIPATPAVIINVQQVSSIIIPNDIDGTANNANYLGGIPSSGFASNAYAIAAFTKANTAITTSGGSIDGRLNIAYTPATTTGYALTLTSANTQGGTGYADFLKVTNTSAGATNPNKSFRLTSAGAIEIINSDYTASLLGLSDTGDFSVAGKISVNGAQAVNGPAFAAYAAGILQTIPSGAQTKVLFQTEEYDTNGCYASSRFTPNVAGYYQLNAEVRIDGTSGTGEMMIILYKNGSEYKRGTNQSGTQIASNFWAMQVSSLVYANGTTDYFEIYVQQGSGGDRTVTAVNNPAITWFNGCMLRGA